MGALSADNEVKDSKAVPVPQVRTCNCCVLILYSQSPRYTPYQGQVVFQILNTFKGISSLAGVLRKKASKGLAMSDAQDSFPRGLTESLMTQNCYPGRDPRSGNLSRATF